MPYRVSQEAGWTHKQQSVFITILRWHVRRRAGRSHTVPEQPAVLAESNSIGNPLHSIKEFGVMLIGSKVLRTAPCDCVGWSDLVLCPVGHTVQLKNSWGLTVAYHMRPWPLMSISFLGSKSSSGLGLLGN